MYGKDKLTEILEKQTALLELLARNQGGQEQKDVANVSTYTPLHGVGGIWAACGLDENVITAHVRPVGLAERLPLIPTVFTNPLYGVLTGYTGTNGDQPANACDDAPTGYVKGGTLTAQIGRLRFDTNTIDYDDTFRRLHRGDMTDLQLRGQVLGLTNLPPSGISQSDILNVVLASEMVTVGVAFERALSRQIWQGSTAVANQFPGLDSQIATGHVDALTGVAMPAVDSDVKDFAYDLVGGSGRDIAEYLSMLEFYLRYNASTMGLDPVTWVIVMRPEAWFELSAIWPCVYNTSRCSTVINGQENSRLIVDARENVAERDAMRNGRYLDINGNRYQVILDTGIFEHTNTNNANVPAGQYASSIYMVPLTVTGGFPVTYREHMDYRSGAANLNTGPVRPSIWWTDNGLYSWTMSEEKWCYKLSAKTEQRVVLRTPHLAGRIDHVRYSPLQHLRESYPDSPYFHNGGVSLRSNAPNYQAVWMS